MVQTKKLLISGGAAIILLAASAGVVRGLQASQRHEVSVADLNRQCKKHRDEDGFGQATLTDNLVKNQTGSIDVDCVLKIPPGTTVQMQRIKLVTKKLIIEAGEANQTQSHLILDDVDWRSLDGGLQFTLQPNRSSLTIKNSRFDYPLSIGANIGTLDEDLQTAIDVQNSQFSSKGAKSDGINLVAMGKATFIGNQFNLNNRDDIAIIFGETCTLKNNTHANQHCHEP